MNFKHQLISLDPLEQINSPTGRYYVTPEGNHYSSVTTILGTMLDKGFLDEWIARVGEREAERIKNQAATRGTKFHEQMERLVLNQEIDIKKMMPLEKMLFTQAKTELERNLDIVYGSEVRLYSDRLKAAGSCDLIGRWKGKDSVLDFKTSRNIKEESDILSYFLQCTMYAMMLWEMQMIKCTQIVVIIACDSSPKPLIYEKPIDPYISQAIDICKKFHSRSF